MHELGAPSKPARPQQNPSSCAALLQGQAHAETKAWGGGNISTNAAGQYRMKRQFLDTGRISITIQAAIAQLVACASHNLKVVSSIRTSRIVRVSLPTAPPLDLWWGAPTPWAGGLRWGSMPLRVRWFNGPSAAARRRLATSL